MIGFASTLRFRKRAAVFALALVLPTLTALVFTAATAHAAAPPAPQWVERSPAKPPSPRKGASLAFDPANERMLLFGGGVSYSQAANDTWLWIDAGWAHKSTAHSPTPREGAALALDPITGKLLLFGGQTPGPFFPSYSAETWLWDGDDWSLVTTAHAPAARSYASLALDPVNGRLLLYGGGVCVPLLRTCFGSSFSDTWTWNGSDWVELTPAHVPPARTGAAAALDEASGEIVLFGGAASLGACGGTDCPPFGDTWTWDGSDWTVESPAHSPPPRWFSSAAFDPGAGAVVLFGGQDATSVLGDTWQWTGADWVETSPAASPAPRLRTALATDPSTQTLLLFGGDPTNNLPSGRIGDTWTETPTPLDFAGPASVRVGGDVTLSGAGITAGTILKVFLSTATGSVDLYPAGIAPTSTTPTSWQGTLSFPWPVGGANATNLGNGMVSLVLIAADRGSLASPPHGALLLGDAALGVPTITALGGVPISETSTELVVGTANVESVITPGAPLVITGEGFDTPVVNLFTAAGNVGPLTPTTSSATSITIDVPANAPVGPGSVQVLNTALERTSNAVSIPIGETISVTSVSVGAGTVTVNGTGFSTATVINLFAQGGGVNLGGLDADGTATIPLTSVTPHQLTFTLPDGMSPGSTAYVQALNPPFIPFTSSGDGPGGEFVVP